MRESGRKPTNLASSGECCTSSEISVSAPLHQTLLKFASESLADNRSVRDQANQDKTKAGDRETIGSEENANGDECDGSENGRGANGGRLTLCWL
jgi:hypothetical protein